MESLRTWTRSPTEDICLYSSSKMYEIDEEINLELQRGLLVVILLKC
jgi:hypothetical protein